MMTSPTVEFRGRVLSNMSLPTQLSQVSMQGTCRILIHSMSTPSEGWCRLEHAKVNAHSKAGDTKGLILDMDYTYPVGCPIRSTSPLPTDLIQWMHNNCIIHYVMNEGSISYSAHSSKSDRYHYIKTSSNTSSVVDAYEVHSEDIYYPSGRGTRILDNWDAVLHYLDRPRVPRLKLLDKLGGRVGAR